jgi:hypothetical protein
MVATVFPADEGGLVPAALAIFRHRYGAPSDACDGDTADPSRR